MTAEIAVMNRFGVALATDSAVTIGEGRNTKIYQTANKLFEVSDRRAVGMMIYNSADFFGAPWEIVIKEFRSAHGDARCKTIFDWSPLFTTFIMNKFKPSSDEVSEYVREILESVFIRVRNAYADFIVSSGIATGAIKTKRQAQRAGQRLRDAFNKIVKDEIKFYRAFGVIKSLPGLDAKSVLDSHAVEFEQARQKIFKQAPLGHDEISALAELAGEALISERRSDQVSGIVFAGYGDDELYPSLHAIEIDGIVAGLLRYSEVNRVDIDRTKTTGAVIPFAQRDVADRYLYGADSRFERVVVDYFADTAKRIGEEVIDVLLKRSGKRKSLLKEAVAAAVAQAQLNYWQSASPKTRDDFFDDVNQMVRLMPKQELVSFAEALVNITSIKRKVSYEPETVGGPVDVAIISRHEGFIWVKRKHYFDAALNPRYFWRRFGGGREPSSGGV